MARTSKTAQAAAAARSTFSEVSYRRPIVYLRTSTDEQDLGIEVQRTRCANFLLGQELEAVAIFEEQRSAKNLNGRPQLQEALAMLKSGRADALVVMKLDRLTRSVRDFLAILDDSVARGWALVVLQEKIDTSTFGRLLATVIAAVAEWERGMISSRTKDAMKKAREMGLFTGGVLPPGTMLATDSAGATKVVKGPDADRVAVIWQMAIARQPLSKITSYLNEQRIGDKDNWTSATVHQLLNSKYVLDAGLVTAVDQRIAAAAVSQRKFKGGQQATRIGLLSYLEGIVTCPTCGAKTTPYTVKKYIYFKCHVKNKASGACKQRDFRSTPIEEAVDAVLIDAMKSKEFAVAWKAAADGERAKTNVYRKELAEAEAEFQIVEEGVKALVARANPSSPTWTAMQESYDKRVLAAKRRVQGAREALAAIGEVDPEEGYLLGAWALDRFQDDPWSSTDVPDRDELRQWARVVIRRVTLDSEGQPVIELAPLAAMAEAQRRKSLPKNDLTRPLQGGLESSSVAPRSRRASNANEVLIRISRKAGVIIAELLQPAA